MNSHRELNLHLGQLLAANLLLRLAASAVGVMVALYLARINAEVRPVGNLEVSLIVSISYTIIELPVSPMAGIWSDRYGSRLFLLIGPIIAAIGTQITAFTAATAVLVLARLLGGAGAALSTPPMLKEMMSLTVHNTSLRARIMTLFELTALLGFIVGSMVGGLAFERLGLSAFTALAIVYLLVLPLFWSHRLYLSSAPRSRTGTQNWRQHRSLLQTPILQRIGPAWLLFNVIVGLWLSQTAFVLAGPQVPGQFLPGRFSDSQVGLVFGVYGVLVLLGLAAWIRWLPGRRKTTVMLVSVLGLILVSLAIWVINLTALPGLVRTVALAFVIPGVMLETGFAPAFLALLGDVSDQQKTSRGTLMGMYTVFLGAGQLLGGWLGGVVAGGTAISGLSWATIALSVPVAVAVLTVREPESHERVARTSRSQ